MSVFFLAIVYIFFHVSPASFAAYLLGKTVVVQQNSPRDVLVSFSATQAGTFHATLEIMFIDETRSKDQRFSVIRELRGRAILPEVLASSGATSNTMRSEDVGVNVSHDLGLQFSVGRSRSDEPFATQTEELLLTKSSVMPFVSFTSAGIYSTDDSVDS